MTEPWTPQKVLELAPDGGSASAGQALAKPAKWQLLGQSARALWGELQGSGKDPYRVRVDLSGPAFKCSCPSRKFPCKHALGLLLIHAAHAGALKTGAEPDWVEQWLADRQQAAAAKASRAQQREQQPADPQAQAKRQASRESKIRSGLDELSVWLEDLVRQGLAAAQGQPDSFWQAMAARLVDAQAPGLARLVKRLSETSASGEGWQERLLTQVGQLHLLVAAYRRLPALPPGAQADVRALVGWTQDQDQLLQQPGQQDQWLVLAQVTEVEERLKVHRTWLWGVGAQRSALVLEFDAGPQARGSDLVVGSRFDGELVFFPGAAPLRALVKSRAPVAGQVPLPRAPSSLPEARAGFTAALALNPWLERWPMALSDVTLAVATGGGAGDRWLVRDAKGLALPVSARAGSGWHWLAISGGQPIGLFGEWDGWTLNILAAWTTQALFAASRNPDRTRIIRVA